MPICDPIEELPYEFEGTPLGNACRLAAFVRYQTAAEMCETSSNEDCCVEAQAIYVAEHNKCPD